VLLHAAFAFFSAVVCLKPSAKSTGLMTQSASGTTTCGGRYLFGRKIGSGSFGDIHIGTNTSTGEDVAIKIESTKAKTPKLMWEAKLYKILAGGAGVPKVHWYGMEGDIYVMVLDLLGPSLEDLFNFCSNRLSLKTVLMLGDQMLDRIEFVHARNFLHRDIKPENFLMGLGAKEKQLHVIDFGLAKKYRDGKAGLHIPFKENRSLVGTARYASINTHLGSEQGRRDDLETIGYVMMYFNRGNLPWQGLKGDTKAEKYRKIMDRKLATPSEVLCRNFPPEFMTYLKWCRGLRFDDRPDYAYPRMMLKDLFFRENYVCDYEFDWDILNRESIEAAEAKFGEGDYRVGETMLATKLRDEYLHNPQNQQASEFLKGLKFDKQGAQKVAPGERRTTATTAHDDKVSMKENATSKQTNEGHSTTKAESAPISDN